MEAISSSFFLLLLLTGVLLFLRKKKTAGVVLIATAGFFLYALPFLTKRSFKSSVYGEYRFGDTLLSIHGDDSYEMHLGQRQFAVDSAQFLFADDYDVLLQGDRDLRRRPDGSFGYEDNDSIVYVKTR